MSAKGEINTKRKEKKVEYHEHDTPGEEQFPNLSNVASANECTGLMYKTPVNAEEMESYQELSPMGIPRGGQKGTVSDQLHKSKTAKEAGEAVKSASGGEYSPRHMKEQDVPQ